MYEQYKRELEKMGERVTKIEARAALLRSLQLERKLRILEARNKELEAQTREFI